MNDLKAELSEYLALPANWDGEGALKANPESIERAVAFAALLDSDWRQPGPMLHASGSAGLFWADQDFYADLEFLPSGEIAFYIECGAHKSKGVAQFSGPAVLAAFPELCK